LLIREVPFKKGEIMRKILLPLASLLLLAGCATRHTAVGVGVGIGGPGYYSGYYDGYYGPFYDGYWGSDGFFWYTDRDHHWHRDDSHHFHRDAGPGRRPVHGSGGRRDH
jgi:uncharacterized protein YceK